MCIRDRLEIVARLDSFRASERCIVEIRPCINSGPFVQHDGRDVACVEATLRLRRTVALDLIEHLKNGGAVLHFIHLTSDPAAVTVRRDCRRIDAQIEQRSRDASMSPEDEMRIDAPPAWPVERLHQCSVKEDQLVHGRRRAGPCGPAGVNRSSTAGVTSKVSDTDLPTADNATESSMLR